MQHNVKLALASLHFRRAAVAILPAVLLMLAGALNAKADGCKINPAPFRISPGGATDVTFDTQKNTACTVNFTRDSYAYFKMRVAKKPRGFFGVSNVIRGMYQPPRDYVGDDYFEVHVDWQKLGVGQDRNQSLVRVSVKIAN